MTSTTADAIEDGRSRAEQEILDAIEEGRAGFAGGWISSIFLGRHLDSMGRAAPATPRDRLRILSDLGFVPHPALGTSGQVHNAVQPDGGKPKLYIRNTDSGLAGIVKPADVARAYSAAQGLR